jgi:Kef-type K+ transport system membrane component KefB
MNVESIDPVAHAVIVLAVVMVAGKAAGELSVRLKQPAVLGELLAGMILGSLGFAWFDAVKTDPIIDVLAGIGVLILLFEVGVVSTVGEMMQVGGSAAMVATLGVVVPLGLGWAVAAWLQPEAGPYSHAFLGGTLCATSVGITARVLQDVGASRRPEARIVLGAAVIDDVLGLMVLAIISGAIGAAGKGEAFSTVAVSRAALEAAVFLVGAVLVGQTAVPRVFAAAARLKTPGVLLALSLSFCFTMAWLAALVGLAPIIGAFAAGLVLEETHFRGFTARGERSMDDLLRPLADFLVPVFFVLMGLRTDVRAIANPGLLALTIGVTVAAIAGKQACALGVLQRGVDRLSVGIGMIPRGEVGLIFANIGLGLTLNGQPVMSRTTFSAIVIMVFVTTMVTPPALKWSLSRRRRNRGVTRPAA